jgi:two-component system, response regulator RegA
MMRVLVVEDDRSLGPLLCAGLVARGATVVGPVVVPAALAAIDVATFDAALVDLRVAGLSGEDVITALATTQPACRVVVLTGFGSIDSAVQAMRRGAHDYLQKPASDDEIWAALQGQRGGQRPEMPSLDRVEREHIERALGYTGGNVSRAAALLGMHRRSLQRKLNKDPR